LQKLQIKKMKKGKKHSTINNQLRDSFPVIPDTTAFPSFLTERSADQESPFNKRRACSASYSFYEGIPDKSSCVGFSGMTRLMGQITLRISGSLTGHQSSVIGHLG
jgi:hypothetical protein